MLTRSSQADVRPGFALHLWWSFALRLTDRSTLRANLSNNSFATATDLGVYRGGLSRFRASGTLSKRDPVDYFKIQVAQGASWSKTTEILKVRSGRLQYTLYADNGSGITKIGQTQHSKGTFPQVSEGFSNYPVNATLYLKYARPKGTTRYQESVLFF